MPGAGIDTGAEKNFRSAVIQWDRTLQAAAEEVARVRERVQGTEWKAVLDRKTAAVERYRETVHSVLRERDRATAARLRPQFVREARTALTTDPLFGEAAKSLTSLRAKERELRAQLAKNRLEGVWADVRRLFGKPPSAPPPDLRGGLQKLLAEAATEIRARETRLRDMEQAEADKREAQWLLRGPAASDADAKAKALSAKYDQLARVLELLSSDAAEKDRLIREGAAASRQLSARFDEALRTQAAVAEALAEGAAAAAAAAPRVSLQGTPAFPTYITAILNKSFEMAAPPPGVNNCPSRDPSQRGGRAQRHTPAHYQRAIAAMADPDVFMNLLVYHDMGTGKTCSVCLALQKMARHFANRTSAGAAASAAASAVDRKDLPTALVLIQNAGNLGIYLREMAKCTDDEAMRGLETRPSPPSDEGGRNEDPCGPKRRPAARAAAGTVGSYPNTHVWHIVSSATQRPVLRVIVQKMTVRLPQSLRWDHDAELPKVGAIFVDEAHNLFDTSQLQARDENWSRHYIAQMLRRPDLKQVLLTGTPATDADRFDNLARLLDLLLAKGAAGNGAITGRPLSELSRRNDAAHSNPSTADRSDPALLKRWFTFGAAGAEWASSAKAQEFRKLCYGYVSHMTLEHDRSRYPAMAVVHERVPRKGGLYLELAGSTCVEVPSRSAQVAAGVIEVMVPSAPGNRRRDALTSSKPTRTGSGADWFAEEDASSDSDFAPESSSDAESGGSGSEADSDAPPSPPVSARRTSKRPAHPPVAARPEAPDAAATRPPAAKPDQDSSDDGPRLTGRRKKQFVLNDEDSDDPDPPAAAAKAPGQTRASRQPQRKPLAKPPALKRRNPSPKFARLGSSDSERSDDTHSESESESESDAAAPPPKRRKAAVVPTSNARVSRGRTVPRKAVAKPAAKAPPKASTKARPKAVAPARPKAVALARPKAVAKAVAPAREPARGAVPLRSAQQPSRSRVPANFKAAREPARAKQQPERLTVVAPSTGAPSGHRAAGTHFFRGAGDPVPPKWLAVSDMLRVNSYRTRKQGEEPDTKHFVFLPKHRLDHGTRRFGEWLSRNGPAGFKGMTMFKPASVPSNPAAIDAAVERLYLCGGIKPARRYAFLSVEAEFRFVLAVYNHRLNARGDFIRMAFACSSAAEGIDLFSTQYTHVLEPPLTASAWQQVSKRPVRFCAFADEPDVQKWAVTTIVYVTADSAREQRNMQTCFRAHRSPYQLASEALRQSAIDCPLFRKLTQVACAGPDGHLIGSARAGAIAKEAPELREYCVNPTGRRAPVLISATPGADGRTVVTEESCVASLRVPGGLLRYDLWDETLRLLLAAHAHRPRPLPEAMSRLVGSFSDDVISLGLFEDPAHRPRLTFSRNVPPETLAAWIESADSRVGDAVLWLLETKAASADPRELEAVRQRATATVAAVSRKRNQTRHMSVLLAELRKAQESTADAVGPHAMLRVSQKVQHLDDLRRQIRAMLEAPAKDL
ncbi:hypothetical protein JKP88DRAFT_273118 [Tribonema minus]|uniref:Helicase ATP-binding domain-containing protein n=1 Tax=Tribonema minus TaxID=303371 RepID=A0A835Z158_9STRA|nr:hypothetical protein JKP88DRAFT_273118 [Tribonema minus]